MTKQHKKAAKSKKRRVAASRTRMTETALAATMIAADEPFGNAARNLGLARSTVQQRHERIGCVRGAIGRSPLSMERREQIRALASRDRTTKRMSVPELIEQLSAALIKLVEEGVRVRLMADATEARDIYSQVNLLRRRHVNVCIGTTTSHHHKTVIIDGNCRLDGVHGADGGHGRVLPAPFVPQQRANPRLPARVLHGVLRRQHALDRALQQQHRIFRIVSLRHVEA